MVGKSWLLFPTIITKENNFTIAENRKFDAMYKSYINHDYEIVA